MKNIWLILVFGITIVGVGVWWWRGGGSILGEKDGRVEILAVGDVMLGRSVNMGMQKRNDFLWPFRETADSLRSADVTFGNLEGPLVANCPSTSLGMVFCGDLAAVKGLKFAGFDVISVANNHTLNHGLSGLQETVKGLKEAGIAPIGNGYSQEMVIEGVRIKWLGWEDVDKRLQVEPRKDFSTSSSTPSDSENQRGRQVVEVVKEASETSDVVIVSMHWGNEYTAVPSKRQREIGEALIDAGAKIVIGHHPHWVQPIERYKDGVIAYSLGNFVFDQMWSEETRKGEAVRFRVGKEGLVEYELLPLRIYDYGQPRWLEANSD